MKSTLVIFSVQHFLATVQMKYKFGFVSSRGVAHSDHVMYCFLEDEYDW